MDEIGKVKREIRRREWMMQIQECQNSGMKVNEWCRANNIRPSTYYSRLKKVRMKLLSEQPVSVEATHPAIVPVSVSALKSQTAISSTDINSVITDNDVFPKISENTLSDLRVENFIKR